MLEVQQLYWLKDDSIGPPKHYLRANISKFQLPDGSEGWSALAIDYVKTAVQNLKEVLSCNDIPSKLRNKVD